MTQIVSVIQSCYMTLVCCRHTGMKPRQMDDKRGCFRKNRVLNVIKVWGRDTGIEGWVDCWKRKLNGVGLIDVAGNYVLLSNQKKAKVQLSLLPATSKCREKRDKTLNHLSYI